MIKNRCVFLNTRKKCSRNKITEDKNSIEQYAYNVYNCITYINEQKKTNNYRKS